jgi:hypothetical protein
MASQINTPILSSFPADEVRVPLGDVEISLCNVRTLLETIVELADVAATKIKSRSVDATRATLDRIVNLAAITLEERQRAQDAFYRSDDVITAHIVGEVA